MIFAIAMVLALSRLDASAAPALTVADGTSGVGLLAHADILVDPRGDLSIGQVVNRDGEFRPARESDLFESVLHPPTYWLRFHLRRGASRGVWALVVHGDVGRVDLFVPSGSRGSFERLQAGFDVAQADDAIAHRVLILPESAYGATSYVRASGALRWNALEVVPIAAGVSSVLERNSLYTFFMGYFLAIGSLYLLLFVILRQRPLLQYATIMALLTALLYVDSGAVWSHFPHTTQDFRSIVHDVLEYLYFVALAAFTATFLRLLERDRVALIAVVVTAALNVTGLVADLVPLPAGLLSLAYPLTIVFFLALFGAGVRAWRGGMRPARYYTLAIAMVLLGYAANASVSSVPALASFGSFIWAFEAAIALEALLLGIAVAERIRETAREYERLLVTSREFEDMALHDALTGVLNRRSFDRGFAAAWNAAVARRSKLGLLMIDVDHFKRYNDRYGHPLGDECLRRVARACSECVRSGDLFARYGGEEFAAIVPAASAEDLDVIGRRMRESVAELGIENETPTGLLTLSIGGATIEASGLRSSQELIALADRALYRAKQEGRDRTLLEAAR